MTIEHNGNKITGNGFALNYISALAEKAAKAYEADGYTALAEDAKDFGEKIYKQLEEAGFYRKVLGK